MELSRLGHQVMAVDRDEERVNECMPFVTNAQIGDSTRAVSYTHLRSQSRLLKGTLFQKVALVFQRVQIMICLLYTSVCHKKQEKPTPESLLLINIF